MADPQVPPNIVQGFKGLNNRLDPTRLGLEWQLVAENVLCDDASYLTRRPGVNAVLNGFKDVYGTRNGRLLAITTGDALVELTEAGESRPLHTGVIGGPFQWVELGYAFFLQSKAASWAVYPDRVIPWGSLCPSPPAASYPLSDPISYPPPVGEVIGARRSQIMVSVWEPERDRSVIYFSRPDFPHEFRLEKDFLLIAGRITLFASLAQGMVIGTDRAIFVDPIESPMQRVADYGVPMGAMAHDDLNRVHFWSERGLCRAWPFENLTDQALAVQQREQVTAGILPYQGSTYAVVHQSGPLTEKSLTRPYTPVAVSTTHTQGVGV
ncbi:MAG: hypothetical protein QG599_1944 [Pseudomonadota bacterium]|nr:hypothetical protein [Pseudomonadota bacterium]